MIARLRILLPFEISLRADQDLAAEAFTVDEYAIRVSPPYQARVSSRDMLDPATTPYQIVLNLAPAEPPSIDPTTTIDGQATVLANAIQIDVQKPDFDRRFTLDDGSPNPGDPPDSLFFDALNSVLRRLRTRGRAVNIRTLNPGDALWRLEFLDDNEALLERSADKMRAKGGINLSGRISALWDGYWRDAIALPRDHQLRPWEELLLDAEALLPNTIPAAMLAAAAVECLIGTCLTALAPSDGQAGALWEYLTNRESFFQEPSVADEASTVLKALTGQSLKEQPELWTAFSELRQVRNNLMHTGVFATGRKVTTPVTKEKAYSLVVGAKQIAEWIEQLLPQKDRRPPVPAPVRVDYRRPVMRAEDVPE